MLESAGLLTRTRLGRVHRCRLASQPMQRATQWLETYRSFWEGQFDALGDHLNRSSSTPPVASDD